jgi:hypothetical protein
MVRCLREKEREWLSTFSIQLGLWSYCNTSYSGYCCKVRETALLVPEAETGRVGLPMTCLLWLVTLEQTRCRTSSVSGAEPIVPYQRLP